MKTKLFLLIIFFNSIVFAQFNDFFFKDKNLLAGGVGVSWIDEKPYYSLRFFPDISFGKIGIGLDLKLEIGPDGKMRNENFNEFSDYLSIIRYLRYGQKNDPFYAKLGALDYATLGHGSIMYMYRNSPGYDNRKVGLELDTDFEKFGFELVYGNFGQPGILGLRTYARPFKFGDKPAVPFLNNIEVGFSLVTDMNKYAGVSTGTYDKVKDIFSPVTDDGSVTVIGFDLGVPVIRTSVVNLKLYLDYAKIINFGSGVATGAMFDFDGKGLVDIKAKLERRWNGKGYLPGYFNSLYEVERFKLDKKNGTMTSKVQGLKADTDFGDGYYGELLVRILGTLDVLGSFQKLDKIDNSGILHLYTDILPDNSMVVARAGYDKINILDGKDLFTLDDRSYLYTEVGYKPLPYLVASIVYHWNFSPVRDSNDNIVEYKPQKRIEPRLSFVYQF